MNKEEIINWLKDSLTISIDTNKDNLVINVIIDGEKICNGSIDLGDLDRSIKNNKNMWRAIDE